jgi:hypothetical protein
MTQKAHQRRLSYRESLKPDLMLLGIISIILLYIQWVVLSATPAVLEALPPLRQYPPPIAQCDKELWLRITKGCP